MPMTHVPYQAHPSIQGYGRFGNRAYNAPLYDAEVNLAKLGALKACFNRYMEIVADLKRRKAG
jgi:hypothetical protein